VARGDLKWADKVIEELSGLARHDGMEAAAFTVFGLMEQAQMDCSDAFNGF
jgi:hypothetical protein